MLNAIDRLIELEEVSYHMDDIDVDEDLVWSSCGKSLLEYNEVA